MSLRLFDRMKERFKRYFAAFIKAAITDVILKEMRAEITDVILREMRKIQAVNLMGDRLHCPACGYSFDRMLPYSGSYYIRGILTDHYTKNALCPYCGSDIRHRLVLTFLKNHTNLLHVTRLRLLHFAPEEWLLTFLSTLENVDYLPCDLNPPEDSFPRMAKIDMTDIKFIDESFDAVIAIHVLEHIQDDVQSLKELYRVLKPGGWALIAVPVYGEVTFEDRSLDDEERRKMYGLKDHVRMNGLDFKNKLANAGFIAHVRSIDDVDGNYVDRRVSSPHIDSDRYLFYGEKPHRIPPENPVK